MFLLYHVDSINIWYGDKPPQSLCVYAVCPISCSIYLSSHLQALCLLSAHPLLPFLGKVPLSIPITMLHTPLRALTRLHWDTVLTNICRITPWTSLGPGCYHLSLWIMAHCPLPHILSEILWNEPLDDKSLVRSLPHAHEKSEAPS